MVLRKSASHLQCIRGYAEARQRVVFREFGFASRAPPLTGRTPIGNFGQKLKADADMAPRLERARRSLANALDQQPNFRQLSLSAGLSQDKLAELADTTQSYIPRIESGTVDPRTDMLAREVRNYRSSLRTSRYMSRMTPGRLRSIAR